MQVCRHGHETLKPETEMRPRGQPPETETLSLFVETRPRRDAGASRYRLETETSRPRPHPYKSGPVWTRKTVNGHSNLLEEYSANSLSSFVHDVDWQKQTASEDEVSTPARPLTAVDADAVLLTSSCRRCVALSTLASSPACQRTSRFVVVGRPSFLASTSVCRRQQTTDSGSSRDQTSWSAFDGSAYRPTGRDRLQTHQR